MGAAMAQREVFTAENLHTVAQLSGPRLAWQASTHSDTQCVRSASYMQRVCSAQGRSHARPEPNDKEAAQAKSRLLRLGRTHPMTELTAGREFNQG